jgi:hypothetical protein
MSKANADIKYDPELPYAVILIGSGELNSRFKYFNEAKTHLGTATWLEIVDTTPKPKIPEDAEFIFVEDAEQSVFAHREGPVDGKMLWLVPPCDFITESELIEDFIGDSEVTVLVRKEET